MGSIVSDGFAERSDPSEFDAVIRNISTLLRPGLWEILDVEVGEQRLVGRMLVFHMANVKRIEQPVSVRGDVL